MQDKKCGCFYCLSIFDPKEITEYVDEGSIGDEHGTAICPYCNIDSVISGSSGYPLTTKFLKSMYRMWFGSGSGISLHTPMGVVKLLFDGKEQNFNHTSLDPNKRYFPDVDEAQRITYKFKPDGKAHVLRFILEADGANSEAEPGELLETASFYIGEGKITLGVYSSFAQEKEYMFDYFGTVIPNGIELHLPSRTKEQTFKFGMAYVKNLDNASA